MNTNKHKPVTGCKSIIKLFFLAGMAVAVHVSYAQGYKAIEITNIDPESLMPKVEVGDKNVYKHIEHLRIPEATVVTDMMWKYGAGNHNAEEYQQLMMRLNTGMLNESPKGYNNYEVIGEGYNQPSNHAHDEWNILNTLVKHANFKVKYPGNWYEEALYNLCKNNENNINIFGKSTSFESDKNGYLTQDINQIMKLLKLKNFILFGAGTNIGEGNDGILRNKIYQEEIDSDDIHGIYGTPSSANGKSNSNINRHLLVTIGTNYNGDIDQTDEFVESSKFPVGFHDKILFAGRAFPYLSGATNKIRGDVGKYATSYTNYFNVAIASILFQMKADTPDVDELLEMIRSTALTDYIRFDLNGDGDTNDILDGQPESQPLQLMNPAGFFQKYLMPTSLPTKFSTNGTTPLEKGYYHGVAYQIPGAEVNINGQWVPFTDDNKELIFSQNPMNLEWRLNGKTLNSYGYKLGDIIKGEIIAVDDQWNGLNITKDFSVNIVDASGINTVTMPYTPDEWYTIDGIPLDAKPTKPGVYIENGQKVIVR